jgi:hypothetical protein
VKQYDVALSFAGENRDYVKQIALELNKLGIKVFYDELVQADLWGKDLYQFLADTYSEQAQYCVVFISEHYAVKKWTRHELKNAQARAFAQDAEYILPIRLDDTELPGLPETIGYLDGRLLSATDIVKMILAKLGKEVPPIQGEKHQTVDGQELLFWKIRSAINSMDPIHLFPMAPTDEYDPEAKEILKELPGAESVEHLTRIIQSVFAHWFDARMAGPVERYRKLAFEIWRMKDGNRVS